MTIQITRDLLNQIQRHGETCYPEEGAGLLLGKANGQAKLVMEVLALDNQRESTARHNRYLLNPQDFLRGELEAARRALDVIGVFHSHPDHPDQPSDYDRVWALPHFSYLITRVQSGQATSSQSWLLREDHSNFDSEKIQVIEPEKTQMEE